MNYNRLNETPDEKRAWILLNRMATCLEDGEMQDAREFEWRAASWVNSLPNTDNYRALYDRLCRQRRMLEEAMES